MKPLNLHDPKTRQKALVGAGVAAALVAFLYVRHKQAGTASTTPSATTSTSGIDPITGIPYALEGGAATAGVAASGGSTGGGVPSRPPPGPRRPRRPRRKPRHQPGGTGGGGHPKKRHPRPKRKPPHHPPPVPQPRRRPHASGSERARELGL